MRWFAIRDHLEHCSKTSSFREEIKEYLKDSNGWLCRFDRQIKPIHWLAFYLRPSTALKDPVLPAELAASIDKLLTSYGGEKAQKQFWYFRHRQKGFFRADQGGIWSNTDPEDFWVQAVQTLTPFLFIQYTNLTL
jgi:hypothetical protein